MNNAVLRLIMENYKEANPIEQYCCSHGINNTGEKLSVIATYAYEFRKIINQILTRSSKAVAVFKDLFSEILFKRTE